MAQKFSLVLLYQCETGFVHVHVTCQILGNIGSPYRVMCKF